MVLTTHPHLALRLKKEYSLHLLPLLAFVECSGAVLYLLYNFLQLKLFQIYSVHNFEFLWRL